MIVPTTINVIHKETLTPIELVSVTVWNADYTEMLGDGITNNNGDFLIGLESDTECRVFLQKSTYTFYPTPKTVAVSETPETFTFEGTESVIPAIPEGLVWLYGEVKDLTLNPIVNAKVHIHLASTPQSKGGATLDRSIMEVVTDAEGKWGTLISGGTRVSVVILSCKFSKTGILPFTGTMDVHDLGLYG